MGGINLDMPLRVPRCEYSVHMPRDLVDSVTGSGLSPTSSAEKQQVGSSAFVKK
jgi:hypothetical protein